MPDARCRAGRSPVSPTLHNETLAKAAALAEAGADRVVVAADGHDFSDEVRTATGGDGADIVVDTVGSRVFAPALRSLAVGGRYLAIGQLFREDVAINPARIIFKCATIVGVTNARRDQLADTVRLVADGTLHPRVAAVLPLSEAARAHAMVEADLLPAQGVRAAPLVDANRTGTHAGPRLLDVGSLEPFA